jgi:hypothetical protein
VFLSQKHKDDLHDSGLDDKIIEEVGCYTCDSDDANKLLDRRDIDCECLVIPYPGIKDYFRLKPDGIITNAEGKPAKYLQKAGSQSRLYIHQAIRHNLVSMNGDGSNLPLLIIEGEKKTLKATQDLFFRENLFLPVGISGVNNWKTRKVEHSDKGDKVVSDYIDDIKALSVLNKIVYICFDSNAAFNEQVKEAENELGRYFVGRGAARVLVIRIPHNEKYGTHGLGLDDYLLEHGTEKFKELVHRARSNESIKYSIKLIRKLPNKTFIEKVDTVITLIIKDLAVAGSFYYDNNGCYYFNNVTKIMLQMGEEAFAMRLADDYGLYRDNAEFKAIISKIEEYATFSGQKITIKHVSYFDSLDKSLYVYNNNGSIYEIKNGADNIISRFNGHLDIFFKHREEHGAIKYISKVDGYFERYILDVCNFQATEFTALTQDQQKFLFTVWFYSLFFPNLLPTKPILVMTGDYGSGKSTIQRLVGKLLFGTNFNVSTIQGERDFLTSIINKYYLVYDNVDINDEWVRNAIASLSTGFKVEVRKMYSNMEMFQADPIAYLAMNSMTQGLYKRPDVASRLLIFRTKRIANFIPAQILEQNILDNRDEILSEVFNNLAGILRFIDDKFSYFGNFRMADFANIGYKIATYFGREKEFEIILNIMSKEQNELPMEDNPLIDILDKWLNSKSVLAPIYISTGELYGQLKKVADDSNLFFPFKSSVSFGRAMQSTFENLKDIYNIQNKRGGGNKILWLITYKG